MSDVALNCALHHCASIVVFDVAFPARLRQVVILREALLAEVLDGVVISIGQKVVQLLGLRVVLELVHQAGPIALNLLLRRDRQKDDLGKLLRVEGSEDAATQDLGLLALLLLDLFATRILQHGHLMPFIVTSFGIHTPPHFLQYE